MKNYQIFYVSSARSDITDLEIDSLLLKAREHNKKEEITGVLLFRAGIFLQLLEGPQKKVESLFSKILNDSRHSNIIKVFTTTNNERIYADWSMAYRALEDLDIKFVNDILSWNKLISAAASIDNHLILHLLSRFKNKIK